MSPQWRNSNDRTNIPLGIAVLLLFFALVIFIAPHIFPG